MQAGFYNRCMNARMVSAFFLILSLYGCPGPEAKLEASQKKLVQRVTLYHECLSWREFDRARLLVAPDKRLDFAAWAQRMEQGYTLDEWVLRDVQIKEEGADILLQRRFLVSTSVMLQTENILQKWSLIDKTWYLAGPPF